MKPLSERITATATVLAAAVDELRHAEEAVARCQQRLEWAVAKRAERLADAQVHRDAMAAILQEVPVPATVAEALEEPHERGIRVRDVNETEEQSV